MSQAWPAHTCLNINMPEGLEIMFLKLYMSRGQHSTYSMLPAAVAMKLDYQIF